MTAERQPEFTPEIPSEERFERFVSWASPGGTAGFNNYHGAIYNEDAPWFEHSAKLIPHSHSSYRLWFVKHEHLGKKGLFARTKGEASAKTIKRPGALIKPGRFLRFAKAYLNHQYEHREPRSPFKALVRALTYLERTLRNLNGGDNDPANLTHSAFAHADAAIGRSSYSPQQRRDAGMELERLACALQSGTADGRVRAPGLHLIAVPFSFKSKVESPPRYGKKRKYQTTRRVTESKTETLSSADVAAIGICYRRAVEQSGQSSMPTFVASLIGVALTTASMRASDLQPIARDALFEDPDVPGRLKLRIPRPKLGIQQILPVPRRLNDVAKEFFDNATAASREVSEAFAFYIEQSPETPEGIQELFVPKRLKELFAPAYIPYSTLCKILGKVETSTSGKANLQKTNCEKKLKFLYFVESPGDALLDARGKAGDLRVRAKEIVRICKAAKVTLRLPAHISGDTFMNRTQSARLMCIDAGVARRLLNPLFETSKARHLEAFISTKDLKAVLLEDFKRKRFPHWPYATKDRSTRLDRSLCVYFEPVINRMTEPGCCTPCWWRPSIFSIACLQTWISGCQRRDPILFSMFDVRLDSGEFPSVSIHKTRRYHHTEALRAGVSPPFANELAGRTSSGQGERYDFRSPEEILKQSIDTFDPDSKFKVIGPVADKHSVHIPPLVDREDFIRHSASPKHMTEAGGCRRDWSLNPCHMYRDCTRCDGHVWQKGDTKRLPFVKMFRQEALESIKTGTKKLRANPRMTSIRKHLAQLKEGLARCNEILRIEADPTIPVGTIVTFDAAPTAMSDVQFMTHLHKIAMARTEVASGAAGT